MEGNGVGDDDIDFSIIGPQNDKQKQVNFSVNELLANPMNESNQVQQQVNRTEGTAAQAVAVEGSFLRDLVKIQQQLSYETNPFDIYQPSQQFYQFTKIVECKQQDTCTRTSNNLNNLTKFYQKNCEEDCKHLIFDFFQQKQTLFKLKIKQNQDYCQSQILQSKRTSYKSDKEILSKSKLAHEIIPYLSTLSHQNSNNTIGKSTPSTLTTKKVHRMPTQHSVKLKKSKSHPKILLNPLTPNTPRKSKQSYHSHKKSHSSSSLKYKLKKKQQNTHKNTNNQNIQALYQYYGCTDQQKNENKKTQLRNKSKSKSKSKSKNKFKKVIFSKKNVYSFH